MGAEHEQIRRPRILACSPSHGPQAYDSVMEAVHRALFCRAPHDPFLDLVPEQGVKLTPRHYAYRRFRGAAITPALRIIPKLRGKPRLAPGRRRFGREGPKTVCSARA
ncbi:MAG: hypothetical protein H6871_01395 [Methylobacteriaceae bacterium]|nr:hypothetical protein [Methylobacteriaceae bacterium]